MYELGVPPRPPTEVQRFPSLSGSLTCTTGSFFGPEFRERSAVWNTEHGYNPGSLRGQGASDAEMQQMVRDVRNSIIKDCEALGKPIASPGFQFAPVEGEVPSDLSGRFVNGEGGVLSAIGGNNLWLFIGGAVILIFYFRR